MAIFTKDGLSVLHIHIPRTGGTSIEQWFMNSGYSVKWYRKSSPPRYCDRQHYEAELINKKIRPIDKWDYSFVVVRHPIDRLISVCKWRRISKSVINQRIQFLFRRQEKNPYVINNFLRPQYEFLIKDVNKILKFENLEDNKTWLKEKFDLIGEMPHLAIRRKVKVLEPILLSEDILSKIMEVYKKDFELFNYNFPQNLLNYCV